MKLLILLIILAFSGHGNLNQNILPLNETDVKQLMSEKMNIQFQAWDFSKKGDSYFFSSIPTDPNAEGITYVVNGQTGTVYERISGFPQANLVIKDSPNLSHPRNSDVYIKEIFKLAQVILDENDLVPDNPDWFSGGYGDGYLFGNVKKGNKTITIKFDIFTKDWEEV